MKILEALRNRRSLKLAPPALTHIHRLDPSPADSSLQAPVHDTHTIAATIERALSAAGLMPDPAARLRTDPTTPSAPGFHGRLPLRVPLPGLADAVTKLPGQFLTRSFSNAAGTRTYKLYIPSSYKHDSAESRALVVMLHGCTQSPDDFAAGTRMNELAESDGFLVAYPAQAPNANGSKCWNWFRTEDQRRDHGEPSLIAGITREVATQFRIDDRRIFVAGLSAGAAMAVILGTTYPELYAAVGAHSGLPYGAACDVPSAFSAMRGSNATSSASESQRVPNAGQDPTPTIVFHGDCDTTVNISNSDAIVKRACRSSAAPFVSITQRGSVPGGNQYSSTIYTNADGRPRLEAWIVHGAAHAWSGGSASGSFTEPRGPDASREMLRFFFAQTP